MRKQENDVERILLTEEQIQKRIKELALELEAEYAEKDAIFVCILNGAAPFYIDLIKELDIFMELNFMRVSSYNSGTQSTGNVIIKYDIETDVFGKHVVIIDDIVDSGHTLQSLRKLFAMRGAASVKACCLLDKPSRREVDVHADYVGFEVPNYFVIGYGLDYEGHYRNIKYIGTLKPEIYA